VKPPKQASQQASQQPSQQGSQQCPKEPSQQGSQKPRQQGSQKARQQASQQGSQQVRQQGSQKGSQQGRVMLRKLLSKPTDQVSHVIFFFSLKTPLPFLTPFLRVLTCLLNIMSQKKWLTKCIICFYVV
jgi:hypothetical protein